MRSALKTILVVDDQPAVRGVLKDCLEAAGYAVFTVENGQAALETSERAKFHAVLLDLGLPDMNGLEVLWKMRLVRPELCIIVVTGCHDEEKGRRAVELGAWDYVTKPVDFQALENSLSMISSETSQGDDGNEKNSRCGR